MSNFASWTLECQKQLWLTIADEALVHWGLSRAEVTWLSYSNNAVFKVSAPHGDFVLRLHPPGRVSALHLGSELRWLQEIRRDTALKAPLPLESRASANELYISIEHDEFVMPNLVYGCLFEFVPGEARSAQALSSEDVCEIGSYLGTLHLHAQPASQTDLPRPRLDWEGLFGEESPYYRRESAGMISAAQDHIFAEVATRVQQTMCGLGQGPECFGLIHGDLLAKNVLFSDGTPAGLDFEFCGWGYYLYDLAPLLWQLKGERATDYRALEDAMWSGYASKRQLLDTPPQLLEDFIAARQLASCRWLLVNVDHPSLRDIVPELLAQRTDELRRYLDTGVLNRLSPTL